MFPQQCYGFFFVIFRWMGTACGGGFLAKVEAFPFKVTKWIDVPEALTMPWGAAWHSWRWSLPTSLPFAPFQPIVWMRPLLYLATSIRLTLYPKKHALLTLPLSYIFLSTQRVLRWWNCCKLKVDKEDDRPSTSSNLHSKKHALLAPPLFYIFTLTSLRVLHWCKFCKIEKKTKKMTASYPSPITLKRMHYLLFHYLICTLS